MAGWYSPQYYVDVDGMWTNEANACDSSTATYASNMYNQVQHWLELHNAYGTLVKYVSKVRLYAVEWSGSSPEPNVRIEVYDYDDSSWVLVYEGSITDDEWVEKAIPGGPLNITRARVYQVTKNGLYSIFRLKEFEFYEEDSGIARSKINDSLATVNLTSGSLC